VDFSALNAARERTDLRARLGARAGAVDISHAILGCHSGRQRPLGATAEYWGVPAALIIAAGGALIGFFATRRFSLGRQEATDPMAPVAWPVPETHGEIEPDRGPVLVTVEYRVARANVAVFLEEAQALRSIRRRDGAIAWGLFEDAARPGHYVESFLVESWAEHVRQHKRGTAADRDVNERIRKYHIGPEPPQVRHLIAPGPDEG
jgi:hypothetical protein